MSRQRVANDRLRVRGRFTSSKKEQMGENYDVVTFIPSPPNIGPKHEMNEVNECGWS